MNGLMNFVSSSSNLGGLKFGLNMFNAAANFFGSMSAIKNLRQINDEKLKQYNYEVINRNSQIQIAESMHVAQRDAELAKSANALAYRGLSPFEGQGRYHMEAVGNALNAQALLRRLQTPFESPLPKSVLPHYGMAGMLLNLGSNVLGSLLEYKQNSSVSTYVRVPGLKPQTTMRVPELKSRAL